MAGCLPTEELWVETKSAEGKPYYYHAITRDTNWEKPESAKIISQDALTELIAKASEEEKAERERGTIFISINYARFCFFLTLVLSR